MIRIHRLREVSTVAQRFHKVSVLLSDAIIEWMTPANARVVFAAGFRQRHRLYLRRGQRHDDRAAELQHRPAQRTAQKRALNFTRLLVSACRLGLASRTASYLGVLLCSKTWVWCPAARAAESPTEGSSATSPATSAPGTSSPTTPTLASSSTSTSPTTS